MTPEARAHLAGRFEMARRNGVRIDPDMERLAPATFSDGLEVALFSMQGTVAAWKLGGTNRATREAFGVSEPYFGPLEAFEVFESGTVLDRSAHAFPLVVEPEIAVAFTMNFSPDPEPRSLGALSAALAWAAPALEFPATRLADPVRAGVAWLAADRCAAGALVIGAPRPAEALPEFEGADWVVSADGVILTQGAGPLIGGVLGAISESLVVFGRCGIGLPAGTILSTGGLALAASAPPGQLELAAAGAETPAVWARLA